MDKEIMKKRLWEKVDEKKQDLLKLCSQMIRTPSENPPGQMEESTELICKHLKDNNIEYQIVRSEEDKPNIIACMGDVEGKTLLLNGHSGVVPAGDRSKWDFDPFCGEITDTQILGRGTSDMKVGLGALLFVMGLLNSESVSMKGKVVLHVVPDEETSRKMGTKWLVQNGYTANGDACLIAEPISYNNCEVGQKGSLWIHIKSHGRSAHGSIGNYVGENAIVKLTKILWIKQIITMISGAMHGSVLFLR